MNFMNFRVINSFHDVTFDESLKPLVICDIDFTFIRPLENIDYYENKSQQLKKEGFHDVTAEKLMMYSYTSLGMVKQTDPVGFMQMIETIKKYDGKFIFLTARGIESHSKTMNDLIFAGLNHPDQFEIHYTNNEISKGEYIKKTNLIDGYQHISFIDDYIAFISSVHNYFPDINCYLFRI